MLYVVESGKFSAFLRAKGDAEPVMAYASGDLFGEVSKARRADLFSTCRDGTGVTGTEAMARAVAWPRWLDVLVQG